MVLFTIPGEPKGKGRPKFSRQGNFVRTYTPEVTASYENLVRLEYQRQCGIFIGKDIPLTMDIRAYFGIPKSASKVKREAMLSGDIRPTKKPDMDNIVKIIADSLNSFTYHDDSQIVSCTVEKYYSDRPRVDVYIYPKKGENHE